MLKLTAERKEWFTVPQDASGETRLRILYLKPGQEAAIEEKANEVVGRQVGEDFVTEVGFKLGARKKGVVVKSIVDWEGFVDSSGKKLKCTDHNKLAVLAEYDWFFDQLEEFRESLRVMVEEEQEDVEKN